MASDIEDDLPLPLDVIYHCHICHATISDIYRDSRGDKGFRDAGDCNSEQLVTKLWLTECMHLTCSDHFEGKGIPLHPASQAPLAPCPVCVLEKSDHTKRRLFGIRGYGEQDHDPLIPSCWFNTPPSPLPSDGGPADALRVRLYPVADGVMKLTNPTKFQYISLVRFATSICALRKGLLMKYERLSKKYDKSKESRVATEERHRAQESKVLQLTTEKARIQEAITAQTEELGSAQQKLQTWTDREPRIMYYLGLFKDVVRENTKLKEQAATHHQSPPRDTVPQTAAHDNQDQEQDRRLYSDSHQYPEESNYGLPSQHLSATQSQRQRQPTRHSTASSRTLSGKRTHLTSSNVFETSVNPNLNRLAASSKMPEPHRPSPSNIFREQSTDSRILMPPPPRPQQLIDQAPNIDPEAEPSVSHYTFENADVDTRQARAAAGASLLDNDILLRKDGTWSFSNESGSKPGQHAESSIARNATDTAQLLRASGYAPNQNVSSVQHLSNGNQQGSLNLSRLKLPSPAAANTAPTAYEPQPLFFGQRPVHDSCQPATPFRLSTATDYHGSQNSRFFEDSPTKATAPVRPPGFTRDPFQYDFTKQIRRTDTISGPKIYTATPKATAFSTAMSRSLQSPASPFFNPHADVHQSGRMSLPMRSRSSNRTQHSTSSSPHRPTGQASIVLNRRAGEQPISQHSKPRQPTSLGEFRYSTLQTPRNRSGTMRQPFPTQSPHFSNDSRPVRTWHEVHGSHRAYGSSRREQRTRDIGPERIRDIHLGDLLGRRE